MRSILRAPWLLGVLALAACIPGIAGSGHVVSERRIVQPWTKLDVQNGMSVTMSVGESYVTVRSDDNLLGYLETYVDGDTLVVRERPRTVLYATVAEAIIANPVLEGVDVSGGSHLTAVATPVDELRFTVSGGSHAELAGIVASWMRLDASGGSHVTASGGVTDLVLVDSGGSHVGAAGLTANTALVGVSGGSHLDLTVTTRIEGDASGGSHVTVYGRPANPDLTVSGGSTVTWAGD